MTWTEPHHVTLTTNAQGNAMTAVRGGLVNGIYSYTLSAVADPVTTGNVNADPANFATLCTSFTHYRPLAISVEAEYVGEAQLGKGVIGLARAPTFPGGTGAAFSHYLDEKDYVEASTDEKVAGRLGWAEGDFYPTSGGVDTPCLIVFAIGLPASVACVRLHIRFHFELKMSSTSLYARSAQHTMSHPAALATTASIVGSKATIASGPDPVQKLVRHTEKLVTLAGSVNGLINTARPLASLMADFLAMV